MTVASLSTPSGPRPLDAAKLVFNYTSTPRNVPPEATAYASNNTICTDHMITATWRQDYGWSVPEVKAYGPLSLFPTSSCLHYAMECFEGMKVYAGDDGKLRLFRPALNAARMQISADRISLPMPDAAALEQLIETLVSVDGKKWLAGRPGSWMYLRPTLIGTHQQLGVAAPREAMLFIVMSFMAPLHTLPGGMHLVTSKDQSVRAWVGGFGHAKVGANYGPTVRALQGAQADGFHQILWLYGDEGYCTETGGSNLFFVWKRKDGRRELVTAPLENKLVLDGITRRSCIELAQERLENELVFSERAYTIADVLDASAEGRLEECFSAGTAVSSNRSPLSYYSGFWLVLKPAGVFQQLTSDSSLQYFICPVTRINHRGRDFNLPHGQIAVKMRVWLEDIMYGREEHQWAKLVEVY